MRIIDFRTTLIAAISAAVISGPAFAVTKCPANGQHFSFKGSVKDIGTTKDGQTYYDISNAHCGDTEHDTIAVYPPSPVPKCLTGKRATASGSYQMRCLDDAMAFGGACIASLTDATLTCR